LGERGRARQPLEPQAQGLLPGRTR